MNRLFILSAILALTFAVAVLGARNFENVEGYTFGEYMVDFKKMYPNKEDYHHHKLIFERNLATIVAHNKNPENSWKMGVNKFTDLNSYHMKKYFGYNHKMSAAMRARYPQTNKTHHFHHIKLRDLPAAVDWRNSSIVTDVKDQEMCGSCWAFAATECIESAVAQATGQLLTLSEQNMVDCTPNPSHCGGTGGCEGATAELGYSYVINNGIASEDDYPYKGIDGNCDETIPKSASITSFVMLPQNDYHALMVAVATVGPIAVTVAASPWALYSSGVFTGCPKPGQDVDLNHGVQLVGYGTDPNDGDYWLVRNSWGTGWGEDGYIRIERHSDGSSKWCSPDNEPLDGDGCPGGPSPITVCGSCGIWYDSAYPVAGGFTRK